MQTWWRSSIPGTRVKVQGEKPSTRLFFGFQMHSLASVSPTLIMSSHNTTVISNNERNPWETNAITKSMCHPFVATTLDSPRAETVFLSTYSSPSMFTERVLNPQCLREAPLHSLDSLGWRQELRDLELLGTYRMFLPLYKHWHLPDGCRWLRIYKPEK